MSDLVLIISVSLSVLIIILLFLTLYRGKQRSEKTDENEPVVRAQPRRTLPPIIENEAPRRRHVRQNRVPLNPRTRANNNDDNDEEEYEDEVEELAVDGKIGVKKQRKLELKAEKRANRERELNERQEKKERMAQLDEQRKKEEEKTKLEELKKQQEEQLAREEKERQEYEEYLKLKESFAVDEEGFDDNTDESEVQNKLQTFIDYIKSHKVVLMEELAGHFQMKTQDVIARVQDLLAQELIVGVIDDRGKFIYITRDELESVAKFIRQRGRVSILELVDSSNSLINLTPRLAS